MNINSFWVAEIEKEITASDIFYSTGNFIELMENTINFIESNSAYPKRIKQHFKNLDLSTDEQKKFFAEKLELLLEEDAGWNSIEHLVIENTSFNYPEREGQTDTYYFITNWIITTLGRKTEDEVKQSQEAFKTVINHPEFFIDDVRRKIENIPYIEKLQYIETVKHRYRIEIDMLPWEELISKDHFVENDFIKKCDAEIQLIKKLYELDLENNKFSNPYIPEGSNNKIIQAEPKISYKNFEEFIRGLEYNYLYKGTVQSFKYGMEDNLKYLKQEVLLNLIELPKDSRSLYLKRLKVDLENLQKHVLFENDIQKWYEKYDETDDVNSMHNTKELYRILDTESPSFDDVADENFNKDTVLIQNDFYNHYYELFINQALAFIDEQTEQPIAVLNDSTANVIPVNAKSGLNFKQSHLARSFFDIIEMLEGDVSDKTAIAKFLYFLTMGKEAKERKDFQSLLNAISAENKQVVSAKAKQNEAIITNYLIQLGLKKK